MKWLKDWWAARRPTTTKGVVWFILINSEIQIWGSYYLAWKGKTEVVETLSKTIVAEIIGVVLTYAVKSLAENLSKHNVWPDCSKPGAGGQKQDAD